MADKCKKAKGATLVLCDAAAYAVSNSMVNLQHMRDRETLKLRERLAIVKGPKWAPLHFCPWCRADIDTRPRERAAQAAKQGSARWPVDANAPSATAALPSLNLMNHSPAKSGLFYKEK